MVAVAEEHLSVGVVSAFRLYGDSVDLDGIIPASKVVLDGRGVLRRAMLGRAWKTWVTGSPTSTLLRADLFRGRASFYDETYWHADTEVVFRALQRTDLGFVHQVLTYTRSHPGAFTSSFSDRINSFKPEEGRLVARFGPEVLTPDEYRRRLRRWFVTYGIYLLRQLAMPSRRNDYAFHNYHRREIEYMLRETDTDNETRLVLSFLRLLMRDMSRAAAAPGAPQPVFN
jgi:hypothetical protein